MRAIRLLALVALVLAVPLSRGAAQTCQGMAAFQSGRARLGVDDQYIRDFSDVRGTIEYGVPRSFFGGIGLDHSSAAQNGPAGTSIDANVGYPIDLSDTQFEFCPAVAVRFPIDGTSNPQAILGGSLGYRIGISNGFALVPAAGFWRGLTRLPYVINMSRTVSGSTSNLRALQPNNFNDKEVSMEIGLVFNNSFTVNPGILVPFYYGAKSIYTLGVSINWAK